MRWIGPNQRHKNAADLGCIRSQRSKLPLWILCKSKYFNWACKIVTCSFASFCLFFFLVEYAQRRIFWTRCLLTEPIPAVQFSRWVTAGDSSGLLTMQGFGVCENERSWRETFIWVSEQVSPKRGLRSISTKNTQPGPDGFDTLSGPSVWQIGRERYFFQCHANFQCLATNKSQTDSWTIFLHQPPKTCLWCKETQGRNMSNLLSLKTLGRNYSQPIHFPSAFVL